MISAGSWWTVAGAVGRCMTPRIIAAVGEAGDLHEPDP